MRSWLAVALLTVGEATFPHDGHVPLRVRRRSEIWVHPTSDRRKSCQKANGELGALQSANVEKLGDLIDQRRLEWMESPNIQWTAVAVALYVLAPEGRGLEGAREGDDVDLHFSIVTSAGRTPRGSISIKFNKNLESIQRTAVAAVFYVLAPEGRGLEGAREGDEVDLLYGAMINKAGFYWLGSKSIKFNKNLEKLFRPVADMKSEETCRPAVAGEAPPVIPCVWDEATKFFNEFGNGKASPDSICLLKREWDDTKRGRSIRITAEQYGAEGLPKTISVAHIVGIPEIRAEIMERKRDKSGSSRIQASSRVQTRSMTRRIKRSVKRL